MKLLIITVAIMLSGLSFAKGKCGYVVQISNPGDSAPITISFSDGPAKVDQTFIESSDSVSLQLAIKAIGTNLIFCAPSNDSKGSELKIDPILKLPKFIELKEPRHKE